MDPSEAREHLEMAERIVAASTRELSMRYAAPFFVVWGLFETWVDLSAQLALDHVVRPVVSGGVDLALLLAAITWSALYGMRKGSVRRRGLTIAEREFLRIMGVTFTLTFLAEWTGLFPSVGSASAIWSLASAAVLFFIWTHGNWRAFVCGIIIFASMFAGGYIPSIGGYALAAGLLLGYAGFGLLESLARA